MMMGSLEPRMYIPYEKLRDMDKKDIPEMLSSVVDEADYVDEIGRASCRERV